ncbi:hypothetical protein ABZ470_37925 [Streptosporangium sp. NPDC020072]|uniref:hypothetical protein n=1 Tax=Streptosporangium sp. NPDC020072 TaxID=3154788 RepID=UPI00343A005E
MRAKGITITSARRTARPLAVLSGAALALFLTAQGAGAVTSPDDPANVAPSGDSKSLVAPESFANATSPEAQAAFAEQGRAAGLTEEQITTLQNSANLYLFTMGGRQVALNKVVIEGRADVLIALPDEDAPRQLSPETGLVAGCSTSGAAYHHFCAYSRPNFRGSYIDMYRCARYTIPYTGAGSWDNNQTKGTTARMYDRSGKLVYITPPAPSEDRNADWTYVHTVKNC